MKTKKNKIKNEKKTRKKIWNGKSFFFLRIKPKTKKLDKLQKKREDKALEKFEKWGTGVGKE